MRGNGPGAGARGDGAEAGSGAEAVVYEDAGAYQDGNVLAGPLSEEIAALKDRLESYPKMSAALHDWLAAHPA